MRLRGWMICALLGASGCADLPKRVRVEVDEKVVEIERHPVPAPPGDDGRRR